jgi:hypothetical protein
MRLVRSRCQSGTCPGARWPRSLLLPTRDTSATTAAPLWPAPAALLPCRPSPEVTMVRWKYQPIRDPAIARIKRWKALGLSGRAASVLALLHCDTTAHVLALREVDLVGRRNCGASTVGEILSYAATLRLLAGEAASPSRAAEPDHEPVEARPKSRRPRRGRKLSE